MDKKTAELIKKNKGLLRRLMDLYLEVYKLKSRVLILEQNKKDFMSSIKKFNRRGFEDIPGLEMTEKEIANIKIGGTNQIEEV